MFLITLAEKGGDAQELFFDKEEVTIGRLAGNDIVLNKGNVSKYHSKIVLKDGKYIVVDLKSTNGTFVNGKKITGPLVVRPSDKIYVGDYIINVDAPPEDYQAGGEEHAEGEYEDEGHAEGEEY
ncbi:MAG: FHA domain-containing protein, partial [Myxococcota bacterium]